MPPIRMNVRRRSGPVQLLFFMLDHTLCERFSNRFRMRTGFIEGRVGQAADKPRRPPFTFTHGGPALVLLAGPTLRNSVSQIEPGTIGSVQQTLRVLFS